MITKFYIAGVEIEQPEGVNGFYLERIRDKVFDGFIRKRTSSIKGVGSITITDLEICQLLKTEFKAKGIDGVTEFSIVQNEEAIYLGEVDYGNYSENHNGHISVSFRDTEGVVQFDSNLQKEYEIEPENTIFLDRTELTGKATHGLSEINTVSRGQPNGKPFLFSVPMKVNAKDSVTSGIGLDVKGVEDVELPFWKNNHTESVKINIGGYLSFLVSSSSIDHITVSIFNRDNGKVFEKLKVIEFDTNGTQEQKTVIIDKVVTVGVGGDVCLVIQGTESIQGYNYTFQTTDLSVNQDLEFTGGDVSAILASSLCKKLIEKVSEGTLNFIDEAFVNEKPFITNGLCLRQNKSVIKTSFLKIFTGLSKIYNLTLSIEGNTVYLRKKNDNLLRAGAYSLIHSDTAEVTSVFLNALSDKFYSEVKVGYSEWKSDTILGNLEFNSSRIYDTAFKKSKSTLDLMVNEVVASGKLIEKQRRLQFETLKNNEKTDDKNDNTLFIIDTNGLRSILGENGINEKINPVQILSNHSFEHGHCKEFIYRTGDGNVTATVAGKVQNGNIKNLTGYFTGMQFLIEGSSSLLDYLSFGDKVLVEFDGKEVEVWIEEDLYRIQTNSFNIKGLEIA